MSNLLPIGITTQASVGKPTVVLGTLLLYLDGIARNPLVGTPVVAQINLAGLGVSNDQQAFGYPKVYPTSSIPQTSSIVEFQLPRFIQDDHQQFVEFMRSYYRFLEGKGGPLHFLRRLLLVQDVDTTEAELLSYFWREYAPTFPQDTSLSPAVVLKNVRQFFLAKGTEKSFQFLFRVLFGDDIELYYPRLDILRVSDGKWIQERSIKCVIISGNPSGLLGNRIIGTQSGTTAFVEKAFLVQDGSITTWELYLNRSSIVGEFDIDEVVANEDKSISLRVLPVITRIEITDPGAGYQLGQEVEIVGRGFNSKARITGVNLGQITEVQVYQFGTGYVPGNTSVLFPLYEGVTRPALGNVVFETITKYPGYFFNQDGMISSLKYIQDSFYYQQYSYVIRSGQSRDKYNTFVKNLVHPAGLIFFSEVVASSEIESNTTLPEDLDGNVATNVEIFWDYRNDFNEFAQSLLSELFFVNAECELFPSEIDLTFEGTDYASDNRPLGPTWQDWETWKVDYRPTPIFGEPTDEITVPSDYYALYANTPLKAFANVRLADIIFHPEYSIDDLPEAIISQEPE